MKRRTTILVMLGVLIGPLATTVADERWRNDSNVFTKTAAVIAFKSKGLAEDATDQRSGFSFLSWEETSYAIDRFPQKGTVQADFDQLFTGSVVWMGKIDDIESKDGKASIHVALPVPETMPKHISVKSVFVPIAPAKTNQLKAGQTIILTGSLKKTEEDHLSGVRCFYGINFDAGNRWKYNGVISVHAKLAEGKVILVLSVEEPEASWTSSDGRALQARFLALDEKNVFLQASNGSILNVPLSKLSEASQSVAREKAAARPQ